MQTKKEHQPEQGGRQANEPSGSKTGGGGEQRASDEVGPEPAGRHPGGDDILDHLGAAEMFGREDGEWHGDEERAQEDEVVSAARRAEIFAKHEVSGGKIDKPGKSHPEIG